MLVLSNYRKFSNKGAGRAGKPLGGTLIFIFQKLFGVKKEGAPLLGVAPLMENLRYVLLNIICAVPAH